MQSKLKELKKTVLFLLLATFFSCQQDNEYIEVSPVVADLTQVPYPKLSDYKFFKGNLKNLIPAIGVLPYKPASELFTDYAEKLRFVWLPKNTKATYESDYRVLNLPVGAVLIKSFLYNNEITTGGRRIIETRLMIRKENDWIFADYVWNNEQTEAFLDLQGSTVPISWVRNGTTEAINYKIPNESQCVTCHAIEDNNYPIGIKPQNLNNNYSYTGGEKNQLLKWKEVGYLEDNLPSSIETVVDYTDTSKPLTARIRSYFDIQCASCHQDGGSAYFVNVRYDYYLTNNFANMGVCVTPSLQIPGLIQSKIIKPNNATNSTLHYMMNTNNTFFRMPRVGRTIVHQEGVALVEEWINSLPACN